MKIDSGLTIWVVGAIADSLISEAYEVHCCVVPGKVIHKQALNDVANFSAEKGT
jgi:hypothetical protein